MTPLGSGFNDIVDTLICEDKPLGGTIIETPLCAERFIVQVSLYSNGLGGAIVQSTYATDAGGEIEAQRLYLKKVGLQGFFVQADVLHARHPFSYILRGMP